MTRTRRECSHRQYRRDQEEHSAFSGNAKGEASSRVKSWKMDSDRLLNFPYYCQLCQRKTALMTFSTSQCHLCILDQRMGLLLFGYTATLTVLDARPRSPSRPPRPQFEQIRRALSVSAEMSGCLRHASRELNPADPFGNFLNFRCARPRSPPRPPRPLLMKLAHI